MLPDHKQSHNIIDIKYDNETKLIIFTISKFLMQYTQQLLENQSSPYVSIFRGQETHPFIVSSDLGLYEQKYILIVFTMKHSYWVSRTIIMKIP